MRAVLDTNVAVSAAINPDGTPALVILRWGRGAFTWVTSTPLLDELTRTFSAPRVRRFFTWTQDEVDRFLRRALETAEVVSPHRAITRIAVDPSDNRVLEAAAEGTADYIVTGDRHLLDLKSHEGTQIVTPADFLVILTTEANQ